MGGFGSGRPRLSDEQRAKPRDARDQRLLEKNEQERAAKVISGPWLREVPEPEYPLNDVGRAKYFELARALFEQQKLTTVTREIAQNAAALHQTIHMKLAGALPVRASDLNQMQSYLRSLQIAEGAKAFGEPKSQKSRFASSGFSASAHHEIRLFRKS